MKTFFLYLLSAFFLVFLNQSKAQEIYEASHDYKKFVKYDVQKEINQSKLKQKKGLPHSWVCYLIDDFQNKYYPTNKIQWFEPVGDSKGFFHYKGEFETNKKQKEYLYLCWQNYSDGLEWKFWVTKITRNQNKKKFPFEIITTEKLITNIKQQIEYKENDKIDVFLYEFYTFVTDQTSNKISFPEIKNKDNFFGVYYNQKLYLFDENGIIQELKH